ncbi:MAG TPA: PDZ domain-containing protein [Gaiellaceae bacterium]|jgi:PDZ domain-containing protein|nr:PDZ domain-containing protein [Gaiellaceae bacterium]
MRRLRLRRLLRPEVALGLGVLLAITFAALRLIASRDYVFLPDKAHPVAPLVTVAGGHVRNHGGGIYFVDVVVRRASLLEQIFGGPILTSGGDLVPPVDVVAPGETDAEEEQASLSEMRQSQQTAAAVALKTAGRKVTTIETGAQVDQIVLGYPAAGKLEPDDVIVAIDGKPVHSLQDLHADLLGKKVGTTFRFTFLRGSTRRTISLKTVPEVTGSKIGVIGIQVDQATRFRLPIRVSIDAHNVGGPSAGLAFALQVLQELGQNVDHGHKIAATGTISPDGQVGEIGGIKQKTIGAREAGVDAFLVPAGQNAADARKYAHGLRIIPVKNFQQALHALATLPATRG